MRSNMDVVKEFFTGKSENYLKAKEGLKKVKEKFDGFIIAFPDVTTDEIILIKDKWEDLPKEISNGVKMMAMKFTNNIKTLLIDYKPNGYMIPHAHEIEYEYGRIIKGSITNRLTGKTYFKDDEYRFSPNELHYLVTSKEGCVIHTILTKNDTYIIKPLSKTILNKLQSA